MTTEVISLSGTSTVGTTAVDFDIESQYDGCNITIEHAFTIKALPVNKTCIPDEPVLPRWQHLVCLKLFQSLGILLKFYLAQTFQKRTGFSKDAKEYRKIRMRV